MQDDGEPIGLRFTNCVAKVRMNYMAKQVLLILKNNKIDVKLWKSYVEDVRWLIATIERGLVYDPGYEEKNAEMSEY